MAERDAAGCPSNRRLPPRMDAEFGCKICVLCADSLQSSVLKFSDCVQMCVCILRFQSVRLLSLSIPIAAFWFCLPCPTIGK